MPCGKLVKVGAWENGNFIGVVVFGKGATHELVRPYGLMPTEGCELVRVAFTKHLTAISRVLAISIKLLKRQSPNLRLVVSFADPEQNHFGGIYQASGWIYIGKSAVHEEFLIRGKRYHGRSLRSAKPKNMTSKQFAKSLDKDAEIIMGSSKHRYLMPLDNEMRDRIAPLAQPYPKRVGSAESGTPDLQSGRGGATPTSTLPSPTISQ
jgi:hypothetical protein